MLRDGTVWPDFFRLVILVTAFVFAGTSVSIILRTNYTSAKIMLCGILCLTLGHITAAWKSLGEPSPGMTYLIGTPLGYWIAMWAMIVWRHERGVMTHDKNVNDKHCRLWHWFNG